MRALRAPWTLLRILAHGIAGWFTIVVLFPRWTQQRRDARVQDWSRQVLRIMGIGLVVRGEPPRQGPVLLVANHMSWLDIVVMHAARHCRFVAKSDVRRWPLVGTLATGGGTLYIERDRRRDAMRVVHDMVASLRAGGIVAVFPEGTTGDGTDVLPFHANLFQAAITSGAPVQPVGVRYVDLATGAPSRGPLYIGDDTLVGSLWRTMAGPAFEAQVVFGEPQSSLGRDRRQWAVQLRQDVDALRKS